MQKPIPTFSRSWLWLMFIFYQGMMMWPLLTKMDTCIRRVVPYHSIADNRIFPRPWKWHTVEKSLIFYKCNSREIVSTIMHNGHDKYETLLRIFTQCAMTTISNSITRSVGLLTRSLKFRVLLFWYAWYVQISFKSSNAPSLFWAKCLFHALIE